MAQTAGEWWRDAAGNRRSSVPTCRTEACAGQPLTPAAHEQVKLRVETGRILELAISGKSGMHPLYEITALRKTPGEAK